MATSQIEIVKQLLVINTLIASNDPRARLAALLNEPRDSPAALIAALESGTELEPVALGSIEEVAS